MRVGYLGVVIGIALLTLAGCKSFVNRYDTSAGNVAMDDESASLQVPQSVHAAPVREYYPIPAVVHNNMNKNVAQQSQPATTPVVTQAKRDYKQQTVTNTI